METELVKRLKESRKRYPKENATYWDTQTEDIIAAYDELVLARITSIVNSLKNAYYYASCPKYEDVIEIAEDEKKLDIHVLAKLGDVIEYIKHGGVFW